MRRLGTLVRLQIQTSNLKQGEKPRQWYDPSPLAVAEALRLHAEGVSTGDGTLDVHHARHPRTRHAPGENAVTVGFTGHYARMRARFGALVAEGVAGENLIVERDGEVRFEDIARGLAIRSQASGETWVLGRASVAHPCRPFSLFLLGGEAEPEALKETLRFLDGGMRGFRFVPEGGADFTARLGDEVFAL